MGSTEGRSLFDGGLGVSPRFIFPLGRGESGFFSTLLRDDELQG